MPTYEITIGKLTNEFNSGNLRSATMVAANTMGVLIEEGTHALIVVDGDDDNAIYVLIERGMHNESWPEQAAKRLR